MQPTSDTAGHKTSWTSDYLSVSRSPQLAGCSVSITFPLQTQIIHAPCVHKLPVASFQRRRRRRPVGHERAFLPRRAGRRPVTPSYFYLALPPWIRLWTRSILPPAGRLYAGHTRPGPCISQQTAAGRACCTELYCSKLPGVQTSHQSD